MKVRVLPDPWPCTSVGGSTDIEDDSESRERATGTQQTCHRVGARSPSKLVLRRRADSGTSVRLGR